jgi:hypothetical protein
MASKPDRGVGPPPGSDSDSPHAQQIPIAELAERTRQQLGSTDLERVPGDRIGFQPPSDPLAGQSKANARFKVVADIPLVNVQHDYEVWSVKQATRSLMYGVFDAPGQLMDSMIGDDRIQAALGSLASGLFSQEWIFRPANDSKSAREVRDAWAACFPSMLAPDGDAPVATTHSISVSALTELLRWWLFLRSGPFTIRWSRDAIARPYIFPFHPRFTYWHWDLRKMVAITQDGQEAIEPGDGRWGMFGGAYRSWVHGAIRPLGTPWLMRHWGFRDWARYSEKHGIPITKGMVPFASSQPDRDRFEMALAGLGNESTILLPSSGADPRDRYDVDYAEPKDSSWESFPGLIDRSDMAIILALLFENLTTEVKGGSFAAANQHENILQAGIRYVNTILVETLPQIARPFAWLNFGDPDLAPWSSLNVKPPSEYSANADNFSKFGTAVEVLARGGIQFADEAELRRFAHERFNLRGLPKFKIGPPPAQGGSGSSGSVSGGGGGKDGTPGKSGSLPKAPNMRAMPNMPKGAK